MSQQLAKVLIDWLTRVHLNGNPKNMTETRKKHNSLTHKSELELLEVGFCFVAAIAIRCYRLPLVSGFRIDTKATKILNRVTPGMMV